MLHLSSCHQVVHVTVQEQEGAEAGVDGDDDHVEEDGGDQEVPDHVVEDVVAGDDGEDGEAGEEAAGLQHHPHHHPGVGLAPQLPAQTAHWGYNQWSQTDRPTTPVTATLVQVHPNIAAHEDCERVCDILRLLHPGLRDPWLVTLDTADLDIESCYLPRCSASVARIPASSIPPHARRHNKTMARRFLKLWHYCCDSRPPFGTLIAFISSLELSTESCSALASIH